MLFRISSVANSPKALFIALLAFLPCASAVSPTDSILAISAFTSGVKSVTLLTTGCNTLFIVVTVAAFTPSPPIRLVATPVLSDVSNVLPATFEVSIFNESTMPFVVLDTSCVSFSTEPMTAVSRSPPFVTTLTAVSVTILAIVEPI